VEFVLTVLGVYRINFNTRQVSDEGTMHPLDVRKHFPVDAVLKGVYAGDSLPKAE